jgi:dienelactone hydrolase
MLAVVAIAVPFILGLSFQRAAGRDALIDVETLALVDHARRREVPVTVYRPAPWHGDTLKPAIISHGYGGRNTDYSFIALHLAGRGYYVASIQHEVPGDEPLRATGSPFATRKPSWERGVQNILFVLAELKRREPGVDYAKLLLVGHSHGGDTSMLFAHEHPGLVHMVLSLDNRRMPLPRTERPRVFSIRSSDQPADDGVIPPADERARLGMKVVTLPATVHDDMWDGATEGQKAEILRHIDDFLSRGH